MMSTESPQSELEAVRGLATRAEAVAARMGALGALPAPAPECIRPFLGFGVSRTAALLASYAFREADAGRTEEEFMDRMARTAAVLREWVEVVRLAGRWLSSEELLYVGQMALLDERMGLLRAELRSYRLWPQRWIETGARDVGPPYKI